MAILQKMTPSLGFYISVADEPLRSRDRRAMIARSSRDHYSVAETHLRLLQNDANAWPGRICVVDWTVQWRRC